MPRFAIATCDAIPELSQDDQLLRDALQDRGATIDIHSWDAPDVRWAESDGVIVRSVWDYHHRHEQFLSWVETVAAVAPMFNSASLLPWNVDKLYLQGFIDAGLAIVPTRWIISDNPTSIASIMEAERWDHIVLKPTISASAMQTIKVTSENITEAETLLAEILPRCNAMVQPCLASVKEVGETPMLYFGGKFSHAVRRPSPLDHGEELIPDQPPLLLIQPTSAQIEVADAVMANLSEVPAYARVDLVDGDDGSPLLLELELIEPYLFMASRPESAVQLAAVILDSVADLSG